jgi:hypothetical protein
MPTKLLVLTQVAVAVLVSCTVSVTTTDAVDPNPTATAAPAKPTSTATATTAPTAPTAPPEQKVCTKIGCDDQVSIKLEGLTDLEKGSYSLALEAGGKKAACVVRIPYPAECNSLQRVQCKGDLSVRINAPCDKPDRIEAVTIPGTPAEVKVTVKKDARTVGSATLTPKYEKHEPNGPGCSPACQLGSDKLTVKL